MSSENNKVFDHDYDGIQEFDNPLPGWWLVTFYGTIIFSVIYFIYYEFAGGPTLHKELEVQMAAFPTPVPTPVGGELSAEDQGLVAQAQDPANLPKGQEVYKIRCVACHAPEGQGLVGPNLTDQYWIHGDGGIPAILQVVRKGVPDKGMLAWEALLKPDEIAAVVGYVHSLKGTNPPNPKPPQGNLIQ